MEDLLGQVTDDVACNLGPLAFNDKANELGHRLSHVILVIEQIDDLLNVRALHVLHAVSVLLHADLQYVEESLLKICNLHELLVLKQIETRSDHALNEVLVHSLIKPEHVHVLVKDAL